MKKKIEICLLVVLTLFLGIRVKIVYAAVTQGTTDGYGTQGNIEFYGSSIGNLNDDNSLWWDPVNRVLNFGITGVRSGSMKFWGSTSGSTTLTASATGTLNVSLTATGLPRVCTPDTGFALATAGTNTTLTAATTFGYVSSVFLPINQTLTGVSVLAGGTAGAANHWSVAIYSSAGGTAVAKTTSTTVASAASTNAFYDIPFSATYAATGPNQYWIEFQTDGTTDKIQTIAAANSFQRTWTQKPATTAFGTFPSLTPPTTFTADVGPVACLY